MKIAVATRLGSIARAHATLVCGCLALIGALTVGAHTTARAAADQSPGAASNQLFGVHPVQEGHTTLPGGHFNFALVPGQRVADAIVIENFSSRTLQFHVYGADLLTALGGALAPAQPTAIMRGVGAWVRVSDPTVSVAGHGQSIDTFTVAVPVGTSPGQHLGAVVASAIVGVTAQGSPIEARTALIAVVTVPGVVHASATLTPLLGTDAMPGHFGFEITLANTGNVLITYTGVLTIDNAGGHRVATLVLTPTGSYVVPSGQAALAATWTEPSQLGAMYQARATVTVLANGVAVATLTSQTLAMPFSAGTPLRLLLGLGLALFVLIVLSAWVAVRVAVKRRRTAAGRAARARLPA